MDPDAALRMIEDADRVDAETREIMRGLHQWLSRGGFQPDWRAYPTGTHRYRKAYGKARAHSTKKDAPPGTSTIKLKDRYSKLYIWLTVRDGIVVGAMGSDPKRYVGMPLDQAKHVARYGGTGTKVSSRHDHATKNTFGGDIQIGDIVRRSDSVNNSRYVVVDMDPPWVVTRRISGGPSVNIPFPERMLRKAH